MSTLIDRMYDLLPEVHRTRDAELGYPLRRLLAQAAEQAGVLERDIDELYDNWFVETCAEWVVPYIGDLLGVRGLHAIGEGRFSHRGRVANTLAYRRRKGTATMLEQLARDATGWVAAAEEFFETLAWTQHLNHVKRPRPAWLDLRDAEAVENVGTAFDPASYSVDVRRIGTGRGRHNIPNVGLFLWRLQPYSVGRGRARRISEGCYTFHPLGADAPLFNRPRTESTIDHLAEERDVPGPLRRLPLYEELEARRRAVAAGATPEENYFAPPVVLRVRLGEEETPVPPEEILICNLRLWGRPPATKPYLRPDGTVHNQTIRVAVDPVLGRLALAVGEEDRAPRVDFAYGFSDDVGGGPYDRTDSVRAALEVPPTWQVGVSKRATPVAGEVVATLAEAIDLWNAQPAGTVGAIAVMDSDTYEEDLAAHEIRIPEGSRLAIVAADWPQTPVPNGGGAMERIPGRVVPTGLRPTLLGEPRVRGIAPAASVTPGSLNLNGLWVAGRLTVMGGNLGSLTLDHCRLSREIRVNASNPQLRIALTRSIAGGVVLPATVEEVSVRESLLDGAGGPAVDAPGAALRFASVTALGRVEALRIWASDCLFRDRVTIGRLQEGCVRFSYLAPGSQAPRRYRCQPDLALRDAAPDEEDAVRARITPTFTSLDPNHPAYAQLSRWTAEEIRTGSERGSEMGLWEFSMGPQRLANLGASLDEYLRFGLEAGAILAT
jgi:hypothetical protein